MQFLFSRKCLALLGIGALIFSVAFWKAHETEAQVYSAGGSASANWYDASARVSLSFHEEADDFTPGKEWTGQGETRITSSGGFFSLGDGHGPSVVKAQDNGSIYIKIKVKQVKQGLEFKVQGSVSPSVSIGPPQGPVSVSPGSFSGSVTYSYSETTDKKYADILGRSCSWTGPWAWKLARAKAVFDGASVGPYLAAY